LEFSIGNEKTGMDESGFYFKGQPFKPVRFKKKKTNNKHEPVLKQKGEIFTAKTRRKNVCFSGFWPGLTLGRRLSGSTGIVDQPKLKGVGVQGP
jgi:hypothetical protein